MFVLRHPPDLHLSRSPGPDRIPGHHRSRLRPAPNGSPNPSFKPLVTDRRWARPAGAAGRIEFDSVTFTDPGDRRHRHRRAFLHRRAGQLLAITGPSGAGKSTLAHLLLRFYDPGPGPRSSSTGTTSGTCPLRALCVTPSPCFSRKASCSPERYWDNITYGRPRRHRCGRSRRRPRRGRPRLHHRPAPRLRHPRTASAGGCYRAASGSGSPSPAPSCATHPS